MIKLNLRSIALDKLAFEAWPECLFHQKSLVEYISIGTVKKKNLLKKIQVLSEHMELGKNSPLLTIVPDG